MTKIEYHDFVANIESGLKPYAQRSFFADSAEFLNGTPILKHFQDEWKKSPEKLANRTPLQLERDRILYSNVLRKQTEKYHILYSGRHRIIRNYTTHTMRMAHVTRTLCRALGLNTDFAEAIALGSKAGAAPFIHMTKDTADSWLIDRLNEISSKENPSKKDKKQVNEEENNQLLFPEASQSRMPPWLAGLNAELLNSRILKCIPCAHGEHLDAIYQSGAESYWLLTTTPYLRESTNGYYYPATMYGIWRHSLTAQPKEHSFHHKGVLKDNATHTITWKHATYESSVVQFADDLTWIIENINDANDAMTLDNNSNALYSQMYSTFGEKAPKQLADALSHKNSGELYTYFITDFIQNSGTVLYDKDRAILESMRKGESGTLIGPSSEAYIALKRMKKFLFDNVFNTPRINNRNKMLRSVSQVALDLLYDPRASAIHDFIGHIAMLQHWPVSKKRDAQDLLNDDVHRAQLSVDILSTMGDQELFDFVGIQSF